SSLAVSIVTSDKRAPSPALKLESPDARDVGCVRGSPPRCGSGGAGGAMTLPAGPTIIVTAVPFAGISAGLYSHISVSFALLAISGTSMHESSKLTRLIV